MRNSWLEPRKACRRFELDPNPTSSQPFPAENAQISGGVFWQPSAVERAGAERYARHNSLLTSPEDFPPSRCCVRKPNGGLVLLEMMFARVVDRCGKLMPTIRAIIASRGPAWRSASHRVPERTGSTCCRRRTAIENCRAFSLRGSQLMLCLRTQRLRHKSLSIEVIKTLNRAFVFGGHRYVSVSCEIRAHANIRRLPCRSCCWDFGAGGLLGFSINTLDDVGSWCWRLVCLWNVDAIVVVENVERIMEQEHIGPLEATRKSMDQNTGALIGIAVVLSAFFVPDDGRFSRLDGVILQAVLDHSSSRP